MLGEIILHADVLYAGTPAGTNYSILCSCWRTFTSRSCYLLTLKGAARRE